MNIQCQLGFCFVFFWLRAPPIFSLSYLGPHWMPVPVSCCLNMHWLYILPCPSERQPAQAAVQVASAPRATQLSLSCASSKTWKRRWSPLWGRLPPSERVIPPWYVHGDTYTYSTTALRHEAAPQYRDLLEVRWDLLSSWRCSLMGSINRGLLVSKWNEWLYAPHGSGFSGWFQDCTFIFFSTENGNSEFCLYPGG